MGRSIQIMGGSFRHCLDSKVVTFSTRLTVQPLPKVMGEKQDCNFLFCIQSSGWPERLYSSIQVKLYGALSLLASKNDHCQAPVKYWPHLSDSSIFSTQYQIIPKLNIITKSSDHGMEMHTIAKCNKCVLLFLRQLHKELNGHHACLTIAEYLSSSYAAEEKFCTKHKDKVISLGCSVCWNVYCTKCVSAIGTCNGGELCIFKINCSCAV